MPKITLQNGKQVEISQESYDTLAKAVQEKRWKPEINDSYWSVSYRGITTHEKWDGLPSDNFLYSQRNVFRTKEEAEKHLEYLKALAVLKDDADDWEPDWSDTERRKYYVIFNHTTKRLDTEFSDVFQRVGVIYFETKEKAQHSIDTHEEEWLTVFNINLNNS